MALSTFGGLWRIEGRRECTPESNCVRQSELQHCQLDDTSAGLHHGARETEVQREELNNMQGGSRCRVGRESYRGRANNLSRELEKARREQDGTMAELARARHKCDNVVEEARGECNRLNDMQGTEDARCG